MKSVRLSAGSEERLQELARTLQVTESEVIRRAIDLFYEQEESRHLRLHAEMMAMIDEWEAEDIAAGLDKLPKQDIARNIHRLYGDAVYEEWQRKQKRELNIAETRTSYDPGKAPD